MRERETEEGGFLDSDEAFYVSGSNRSKEKKEGAQKGVILRFFFHPARYTYTHTDIQDWESKLHDFFKDSSTTTTKNESSFCSRC